MDLRPPSNAAASSPPAVPACRRSAIAPIVVLTVAIANCVHIFATLVRGMQSDASRTLADRGSGARLRRTRTDELKRNAIVESLRVNLQPVFLASLTTTLMWAGRARRVRRTGQSGSLG